MWRYHAVMKVCCCHETSLAVWRFWSEGHPLSLRAFHERSAVRTDDLPFRIAPTSSTLRGCLMSERAMHSAAQSVEALMRMGERHVTPSPQASKGSIFGRDDLLFLMDNGLLVLEYDGFESHATRAAASSDSRRRDALTANGSVVRTITASQFSSVFEFQEMVRQAFGEVGKRIPRLSAVELEKHMELRRSLTMCHRGLGG